MGNSQSHSKPPTVVQAARHPKEHSAHKHAPEAFVLTRGYPSSALTPLTTCHGLLVHTGAPSETSSATACVARERSVGVCCGPPLAGSAGTKPEVVGTLMHTPASLAGGSLVWELDVHEVFHAADSSRSPCGSNTRLASPAFRLPLPGLHEHAFAAAPSAFDGPEGFGSPTKSLARMAPQGGSAKDTWHMEWALFDHSDSCVSLYLYHTVDNDTASHQTNHGGAATGGTQGGQASCSSVVLSWHVVVEGLVSNEPQPVVRKEAQVAAHDYALPPSTAPASAAPLNSSWGVQGLLSLSDLDALTATDTLRVTVRLQASDPSQSSGAATSASQPAQGADGTAIIHQAHLSSSSHTHVTSAPWRVLLACLSPRIMVIDNFLEPEMCRELVELAKPRLVRSRVSTGTETPSRVSQGTFFTGASASLPLIQTVEERIQRLVTHPAVIDGKKRLVKSEALQAVQYLKGGFYHGHFDNRAGGPVTRHVTILIYLNDVEAGGATYFPRATELSLDLHEDCNVLRPGLSVMPAAGRALLFWSALPNGSEDLASLHSAEIVEGGDKWIATRWFKEVEDPLPAA